MGSCLAYLNENRKRFVSTELNAKARRGCYKLNMAASRQDWYLYEWLKATGKKQADIVRDLDWNKARVSLTIHGKQPYTRDDINELASYLSIATYELLMHPDDAMAIRRLRQEALRVVETSKDLPTNDLASGTNG